MKQLTKNELLSDLLVIMKDEFLGHIQSDSFDTIHFKLLSGEIFEIKISEIS